MNLLPIEQLLKDVQQLFTHQKEMEKVRGEKFNVFSILKMENNENSTHSAFLAELLNPHGSHLKGGLFLSLFLKTLGNVGVSCPLDINSAKVTTEYHIGQRNDSNKIGGRIDVYIIDSKYQSISIENKIYAGDQNCQIERYCNHLKDKNKVIYLNLFGMEPSVESRGQLKAGEDYYVISYKKEIINWLEQCWKESHDSPILRETIKQYILLIRKLTLTMDTNNKIELHGLILDNIKSAELIIRNFDNAIVSLKDSIRNGLFNKLSERLKNDYDVSLGNGIMDKYSHIWIKLKGKEKDNIIFGIQSFALRKDDCFPNGLIIGMFAKKGDAKKFEDKNLGKIFSDYWIGEKYFNDYNNSKVDLQDYDLLQKLHKNHNGFKEEFLNSLLKQSIEYIENKSSERSFLEINKGI